MFRAVKNAAMFNFIFLVTHAILKRKSLKHNFWPEMKKLLLRYIRAVIFISAGSGGCFAFLCATSRLQGHNSRLDTHFKVTAHFALSSLFMLVEPPDKMPIYLGFFLPKALETMTNILR